MTKKEPSNLMRKTATALYPDSLEFQESFIDALLSPRPQNAVIWTVPRRAGELNAIARESLPDWLPDSVELIQPGVKIGRSAAYLAGDIYSLDFPPS